MVGGILSWECHILRWRSSLLFLFSNRRSNWLPEFVKGLSGVVGVMRLVGFVFLSLSDSANKLITRCFFLWLIIFYVNDLINDDCEKEKIDGEVLVCEGIGYRWERRPKMQHTRSSAMSSCWTATRAWIWRHLWQHGWSPSATSSSCLPWTRIISTWMSTRSPLSCR